MESNYRDYTSDDSDRRMLEILDAPAEAYETLKSIPDRNRLTYANGFYVNCTAVFIDIRGSSQLAATHTAPALGKVYRAYISECVALMNTSPHCKEIFIAGDCVNGIFDTTIKPQLNAVFDTASSLNSLIVHLNWRLEQKGYAPIKCGIGISYGQALMLKSGYNGSGINEVVWMGNVVNEASNLCHKGNRDGSLAIQAASDVYLNLTEHNKGLLYPVMGNPFSATPTHYQGAIIHKGMQAWLDAKKIAPMNFLASILRTPPRLTFL